MKFILYLICVIALLSSTGCIFWGGGGDRGYHGGGGHAVDNVHPDHGDQGGDHSDNGGNHDDHH